MAFQKRFDCAPNGYQIPAMPRVPKSAKGKRSVRKKVEDNEMSAFDLLATLAGKLLAEKEIFCTSSKEQGDSEGPLKGSVFDQGSCDESTFALPSVSHGHLTSKQHLKCLEARIASYAPKLVKKSHASGDGGSGSSMGEISSKSLHSSSPVESCVCKVEDGAVVSPHGNKKTSTSLMYDDTTKIRNLEEDPIDSDRKPPVLISSDSSVEFSPYGNCTRAQSSSFPSKKGGKELHGGKDDGENSSVCTHPGYIRSKSFRQHCLEARGRRKLMKSSYRKAVSASYNVGEVSNNDVEMKPAVRSQKLFRTRQRTPRSSSKKRKLFDRSPSCESSRDEAILDSLAKGGIRIEASNLLAALNGGNDISSIRSPNSLYDLEDRPVKLSIKSFKVPELFIEIPANATVGSLKRTVMEAVMAILGDGLHVGVLLHGKKIRDDNKTIRQAGISYEDKMNSVGFTLEPNRAGTPSPRNNFKEPAFMISDSGPLFKFQATDATFRPPPIVIPSTNCNGSDHENSVLSPVNPPDNMDSDSKALVPLAAINSAAALSVVPSRKYGRSEVTQQRRIRRPFSVSEVEALVQAVEKLGTGRWRDVKLRAFDNAKHRTYVDLKDKWKTLVHTARISPQQRRGEPVPQELLDRVLSAHSHWSREQAKLPGPAEPLLLA